MCRNTVRIHENKTNEIIEDKINKTNEIHENTMKNHEIFFFMVFLYEYHFKYCFIIILFSNSEIDILSD